jgi:hypothetical protein|tara:strand:+ start:293 stop:631 length:339 start_codon:yes stop_codon:yes gene_type:complete
VEKDMTVYITQEMRGRDITDATSFGDVEILVPAGEQASYSTQPIMRQINRKLSKFSDDDYLILAGDPVVIALCACLAARTNRGKFKMLKWDRQEGKYFPLTADLNYRPGGDK